MSEWTTSEKPTVQDGMVWVWRNKRSVISGFAEVVDGEPWQPISRPANYIEPIKWTMHKRDDGYQYESLCGHHVFIAKELASDESARALLRLVRMGGSGVWDVIRAIINKEIKR